MSKDQDMEIEKAMENDEDMIMKSEREWAMEIIQSIRMEILKSLFAYDLDPVGKEGDERKVEIIRFYRGLLKAAINQELFDQVDGILKRKIDGEFDKMKEDQ
jgi:hypothetical protein